MAWKQIIRTLRYGPNESLVWDESLSEEESSPYRTLITGDYHLDYLILSYLPLLEIKKLCDSGEYFAPICADDNFWNMVANHHFPGVIPTVGTTWFQLVKFLTSDEVKNIDEGLNLSAYIGNFSLVKYFIGKGATNYDDGMYWATRGGHQDLVEFFISLGANDWNYGLYGATLGARGGHKNLIKFFSNVAANYWNYGVLESTQGPHEDLRQFFISRGGNNLNKGKYRAEARYRKELETIEWYIAKGANNYW